MMNDERLENGLSRGIERTVKEFQEHPYDFLYESDIRSLLFTDLRSEFTGESLFDAFSVGGHDKLFDGENVNKISKISPVKSEYRVRGLTDYPKGRFDIAILDEKCDSGDLIWDQGVRCAIEIKLWQPEGTGHDPWKDDFKKLKKYCDLRKKDNSKFTGISILFVHPGTKSKKRFNNIQEKGIPSPYNNRLIQIDKLKSYTPDGVIFYAVTSKGCHLATILSCGT